MLRYFNLQRPNPQNSHRLTSCVLHLFFFTFSSFQGILLLEDLAEKHAEGNRDYIYYLAIGYSRIKNYSTALKFCKAFLQIEPTNQQALTLEVSDDSSPFLLLVTALICFHSQEHIRNKKDKEAMAGAAVTGGAILVLGGLVGIGLAALASRK